MQNLYKWKHFSEEIIIQAVYWYLKYSLSYRDVQELLSERGLDVCHTTIYRWVIEYSPLLASKIKNKIRKTNDSWRVDETHVKVNGQWTYLYRAIDSDGNTLDFMLSKRRNKKATIKFFRKILGNESHQKPRVITTDKYSAYPISLKSIKTFKRTEHRQIKYLNNIIEQDHKFIKKKIKPMLGFKSFNSAKITINGIEALHMMKKGQVGNEFRSGLSQFNFVKNIMGVVA